MTDVEIVFRRDLLGCARVEAARACDDLASDQQLDGDVGQLAERARLVAGQPDDSRAHRPCVLERGKDKGGATARRDSDDDVARVHGEICQGCRAGGPIVFRALHGVTQCFVTAGEGRFHGPVGNTEGRAELCGVEQGEATSGAGTDVDEPPTSREPPVDNLHG